MARSNSPSSTLFIAILLIITFPFWFGLGAGLFGLVIGLFGAAIGILAAIFGVCIAIIAIPFKILFGSNDWGWHSDIDLPFFHTNNGFLILLLIVIAVMITMKGKKTGKA